LGSTRSATPGSDKSDLELLGGIDPFPFCRSGESSHSSCGSGGSPDEIAAVKLGGLLLFRAHGGFGKTLEEQKRHFLTSILQ